MKAELDSKEREPHTGIISSEFEVKNTHQLLLLALILSAVSSLLAIVVAVKGWRETQADSKKKAQAEKDIKSELQELHKEIALLKNKERLEGL